jgi:hypothetical protein
MKTENLRDGVEAENKIDIDRRKQQYRVLDKVDK